MAAMFSQNPLMNGPHYATTDAPKTNNYREHRFYPYTDNGGTTLAISGADFTVMAGDTRHTAGYSINSRTEPKLFKIGGTTADQHDATIVLSVCGFAADGNALRDQLDTICKIYRYRHGKAMTANACAKRLSTILYGKRFFPYYVHAMLGGIDEEGKGVVYSYDPVGSYERETCRAGGAGGSLIMPFLDNQVNFKNQYAPGSGVGHDLQERERRPLLLNEVETLVKDAFDGAAERHIEVGDALQMFILTKDGIEEKILPIEPLLPSNLILPSLLVLEYDLNYRMKGPTGAKYQKTGFSPSLWKAQVSAIHVNHKILGRRPPPSW